MVQEEINQKKLLEISPDKISLPTSSTYVLSKIKSDEAKLFIGFLKEELTKF